MEQRRESRLNTNSPATITVLGLLGEPSMPGSILDMAGSGLRVSVPHPIPCGVAVKVETSEMVLLGEVCRCEAFEGGFEAGLTLSHSVARSDLKELNSALRPEDSLFPEKVPERG